MKKAGLAKHQCTRLLSDNGSCYVAADLKTFLKDKGITPVHGRQCHPQTLGKIERYHRSMKNVVKLDHYYFPEELIAALEQFVHYYNHLRYHESLDNVTPADVNWGRKELYFKEKLNIYSAPLRILRRRHKFWQLHTKKSNKKITLTQQNPL